MILPDLDPESLRAITFICLAGLIATLATHWFWQRRHSHQKRGNGKATHLVKPSHPPAVNFLLALFAIYFIIFNILSVPLVPYNETDTKYDFASYLISKGESAGMATQLGGIYYLYPPLYRVFGIDSFRKSIIFDKVSAVIIFLLSILIARKLFDKLLGSGGYSSLLLTIFYFSLPLSASPYWQLKAYYLAIYLLMLWAFISLLEYFDTRSASLLVRTILLSILCFQGRPEFLLFAAFFLLLNFLELLHKPALDAALWFSLQFATVALLLCFFVFCYLPASFRVSSDYGGGLRQTILNNAASLRIDYLVLGPIFLALLGLALILLFVRRLKNQALAFCSLFFVAGFICANLLSFVFDIFLNSFYISLFVAIIIGFGLVSLEKIRWLKAVYIILMLSVLLLCTAYSLTGQGNLLLPGVRHISYNRVEFQKTAYLTKTLSADLERRNLSFYTQYPQVYWQFVLKDTNITVLGWPELDRDMASERIWETSHPSLIMIKETCNTSKLQRELSSQLAYLKLINQPGYGEIDISEFTARLGRLNLTDYAYVGDYNLCLIQPHPLAS